VRLTAVVLGFSLRDISKVRRHVSLSSTDDCIARLSDMIVFSLPLSFLSGLRLSSAIAAVRRISVDDWCSKSS